MNELFEQSGDMKEIIFEYLSYIFDDEKIAENAEIIRLAKIEAKIKKIKNED